MDSHTSMRLRTARRRELQHRHRDACERRGFLAGIPLKKNGGRRDRLHAAAPHARLHARVEGEWRRHVDPFLVENGDGQFSGGPARPEDFEGQRRQA